MASLNFTKKMKIGPKLITFFLIAGIIPLAVVGFLAYTQAAAALQQQASNQLIAIRDIKKDQIELYFTERAGDLAVLQRNEDVAKMYALLYKYHQDARVTDTGNYDVSTAAYNRLYDANSDNLLHYVKTYGYYDMFIMCAAHGHVMWTQAREKDLGENLKYGQYKDSGLAKMWQKVVDTGEIALEDFAPYAPSAGAPASFIGAPLKDANGKTFGVIALQVPLKAINTIMQQRSGMGETGESYLIGTDKLMRSDSFLDPVNHSVAASLANPDQGSVDTEGANDALAGNTDAKTIIDYNGNPVLSAYTPLDVLGITWALLTEIDVAEAFAAVYSMRNIILIIALVVAGVIAAFAITVAKSFTAPIHKMMTGMSALGGGDLTTSVTVDTQDEIGHMATSFNETSTKLRDVLKQILNSSEQVGNASTQISSASEQLAAGAEEQQAQLSEVATTMEEMSAMILEASKNANETRENAQHTGNTATQGRDVVTKTVTGFESVVSTVEQAAKQIQELSKRSEEIGNVIQVIDDIADQTNLLALNANIEAARAGEAGKGFAVVADEVRKLAERTATATAEIGKMIESIQGDIRNAVTSMEDIQGQSSEGLTLVGESDRSLQEISDNINNVISAVEQIASSTNEQSSGAEEISKNIEGVSTVAKQSASSAQELASSAEELNREVEGLNNLIAQFKVA